MRNGTNVSDLDAPFFYVSVWANDITDAKFNLNTGGGWQEIGMVYDSDHDAKSYWRTNAVTQIQDLSPGATVQYDFKLIDGTDNGWLKSNGFFDASDQGSPFSFTVEGATAQPTQVTADSSATSTVSAWVTNAGVAVSGEVVTFSFVSGPGAFTDGTRSKPATTDASGKASVQIISGAAGTAIIGATSANINDSGDTTASVVFSTFVTDGDPADFPGDATGIADNDSRVSNGALIWVDAANDERTQLDPVPTGNISNYDLRQFRATATADSFRVLITLRDLVAGNYPFVIIAIDTDVYRDTSFAVTTAGPGPATSVKDFGNWWLPANAFTGTRHDGANTFEARGERGQLDFADGTDGFLPNRWSVTGAAIDNGNESTAVSNNQQSVIVTRRNADGNPNRLNWDFNQHTYELYVANDAHNGTADHFLFIADDTSATNNTLAGTPWDKQGSVMAFDWVFCREGSATYNEIRQGPNWGATTASGNGTQTDAADNDDDNRSRSIISNSTIPIEGVVDLDDAFGAGGIKNGDVFAVTSSFQTDAQPGNGAQWDQTPDETGDNTIKAAEWQQIFLELASDAGDNQVAEWERAIAFSNWVPGGGSATALWTAPGGRSLGARRTEVGNSYASEVNDAFEYDISWNNLLGAARPPFTLRFTVGVGEGINGGGDQFDNYRYMRTFRSSAGGKYGDTSSIIDAVSPLGTNGEVEDGDIDKFLDIDFNKDGRINTTPDTPTNLGMTQTADTEVKSSGVILNDATPIFRWSVNDTDGSLSSMRPAWQLQVDNDQNYGSLLIDKQSTSTDSFVTEWEATTSVPTADTYYWRLRTRDDFGWSPWTTNNAFSFRINSAPNIPTTLKVDGAVDPANVADNLPQFTWAFSDNDPGDAQTGFSIEVWLDAALIHADTPATTNQFFDYPDTAPALEGGVTYTWRVRTKDLNSAYGGYSDNTANFMIVFDSGSTLRNVKIAEVGQGHATIGDYIMLYNPNDTTVRLAGTSIQRWSATVGTSWAGRNFISSDTIPASSYYLFAATAAAGVDSNGAFSVITGAQGFALVRNTIAVASTSDSDIIDGIGTGQDVLGTNLATAWLGSVGEAITRKSTQSANTALAMRSDSELRRAGHYLDVNAATDWENPQTQDPRGRTWGQSRLQFALTTSPATYVEQGVPFTLRIRATDANGWKVSDTAASSMTGNARLTVTSGSISPVTTANIFAAGDINDSITISGVTGSVTIRADTTYGTETTAPGPINGTLAVTVQTAQPPTKPVIFSPSEGADASNPVTIRWVASTDTTPSIQYRVQVSETSAFTTLLADTPTYDTQLAIGALSADSKYVRVVATDPGGYADTSTVRAFRIVLSLDHFDLTATDPNLLVASPTIRRGTPFNLRIIAKTATGDTVTTYADTVTISVSGGTISPSSVTFSEGWGGETTVSVTLSGDSAIGQDTITVDTGGKNGQVVVIPLSDNRLIINEVLSTDINTGSSDDRDDWVEIHNRSTGAVSTNGWVLTDVENDVNLPNVSIPSGKFMVVHFREIGTDDEIFTDTDGAAHFFPFGTTANRLSYQQEELGLYSSVTEDSRTITSYLAWTNGASWNAQQDSDAVGAALWVNDQTVNHGAGSAGALAGRSIFMVSDGRDSTRSASDWAVRAASDTYTFTEGFSNALFDTDLTVDSIILTSASGSLDTVAVGESLVVKLIASAGGSAAVPGVTTVLVRSEADSVGIVLTLVETANNSRVYIQEVILVSYADSGSRDGSRWIGANITDTITVDWVKGGVEAVAVVPAPLDHFGMTAPSNVSNGFAFSLTVTAQTATDMTKEDYTGTVNLAVAIGSIAPTSVTFFGSDSGVKTIGATITGATEATTDTITGTESISGETGLVVVNVVAAPALVINEVMAQPGAVDWDGSGAVSTSEDEWVEIFNTTSSAVGLVNWKVGEVTASKVTLSDTISPLGHLTVYRRTSGTAIGYYFDAAGKFVQTQVFGAGSLGVLGNSGDRVVLLNASGDTIDDITYTALTADSSYGRAWDGAGVFRTTGRPTPGETPTLPAGSRDTSSNMRFRIDEPDSATLDESVTLRVVAVDATGETVTDFSGSGIPVTSSGGPTINIATLSFTNGLCTTAVRFQTTTGTAQLTVLYDTNTNVVGRDVVTVVAGAAPADTTPPAKPAGLAAIAVISGETGVFLSWADNTETDLAGYQVYRRATNDSSAAMTLLFGGTITDTARIDTTVLPGETYYHFVVALDSTGNRSDTAGGVTTPAFTAAKILDSTSFGILPGSTLQYRLDVTNVGWGPADSVVIFDTLPVGVTFRDTVTTPAGWEFQYCTTAAPNQDYGSVDYVSGTPDTPALVTFFRWRKLFVSTGEVAAVIRFRVILE